MLPANPPHHLTAAAALGLAVLLLAACQGQNPALVTSGPPIIEPANGGVASAEPLAPLSLQPGEDETMTVAAAPVSPEPILPASLMHETTDEPLMAQGGSADDAPEVLSPHASRSTPAAEERLLGVPPIIRSALSQASQ